MRINDRSNMKHVNNTKIFAAIAIIFLIGTINTSIVDASIFEEDEKVINRYSFTEKELEKETDLYYFNARHYNPKIARFTSTDPAEGFNRYEYCGNNPLKYTDPSGCQYVDVCPADAVVVEQGFAIDRGAKISTEGGYSTFVGFDLDNSVAKSTWEDVVAATKQIFSLELTEEEIENQLAKPNVVSLDLGFVGDRLHHANYVLTDFLWPWKIDEDFWDFVVAAIGTGLCAYTCAKRPGSGGFESESIAQRVYMPYEAKKIHLLRLNKNLEFFTKSMNKKDAIGCVVFGDKSRAKAVAAMYPKLGRGPGKVATIFVDYSFKQKMVRVHEPRYLDYIIRYKDLKDVTIMP